MRYERGASDLRKGLQMPQKSGFEDSLVPCQMSDQTELGAGQLSDVFKLSIVLCLMIYMCIRHGNTVVVVLVV